MPAKYSVMGGGCSLIHTSFSSLNSTQSGLLYFPREAIQSIKLSPTTDQVCYIGCLHSENEIGNCSHLLNLYDPNIGRQSTVALGLHKTWSGEDYFCVVAQTFADDVWWSSLLKGCVKTHHAEKKWWQIIPDWSLVAKLKVARSKMQSCFVQSIILVCCS